MMDLRRRARGAILESALVNLPSALLLSAAILLIGTGTRVPVLDLPSYFWLAGILPAWVLVVASRLLNQRHNEQVVTNMLREDYDIDALTSAQLKQQVGQAITYQQRIDAAVSALPDGPMRVRFADVANQISQWVSHIYTLARRIEAYRADPVIRNDLLTVGLSIGELRTRLGRETDQAVRDEITQTIRNRQQQFDMLNQLDHTMDRAELQIENNLTALGTVYSQLLMADAKDVDSGRAQRLSSDVTEQVASLNDLLKSMDDVYDRRKDNLAR